MATRLRSSLFRHSSSDAALVAIALAEGVVAVSFVARATHPSPALAATAALLFAAGLWWNSNTISHNHLHNPLFRSPVLNRFFSLYLSLLVGVPQTVWRERHLWHHAGEPVAGRRPRLGRYSLVEMALVGALWVGLCVVLPRLFLSVYLPGYLAGLGLAACQGHFEHAGDGGAGGVSFYGALYNRIWLNDGYHVEHHLRPGEHWTRLPGRRVPGSVAESRFPPVLRWMEGVRSWANRVQGGLLDWLEGIALGSTALQRFLVERHARAFRALLPVSPQTPIVRVAVVGGGLFPRTALVLGDVLPACHVTVIDSSAEHVARARTCLAARGMEVEFLVERFDPVRHRGFDLLVLPLGYRGRREGQYALPSAKRVLIHDWIWRVRGPGCVVSLFLLKRLNLVERDA